MNIMGEIGSGWNFIFVKFDLGKLDLGEIFIKNKVIELWLGKFDMDKSWMLN